MEHVDCIVAGHICLDIIPQISNFVTDIGGYLSPGSLRIVGPAIVTTGGCVANTGLAMHKLGTKVRLIGKIGEDILGSAIVSILSEFNASLGNTLIISKNENTSYTIVLNPPGIDRIFFHCPGANDTFEDDDITDSMLSNARHFHFGYPPLMRQFYANDGIGLQQLFALVKSRGLTTSLDMAMVDPHSEAQKIQWREVLRRTLPYVDLFLPSLDEVMIMLDDAELFRLYEQDGITGSLLSRIGKILLSFGTGLVGLKLGDKGFFAATTSDSDRLSSVTNPLSLNHENYLGREIFMPCYRVNAMGTTGAGDSAIAGFLSAVLRGYNLEAVIKRAVGAGACSVETTDSISGILSWEQLEDRIADGWEVCSIEVPLSNWRFDETECMWIGPKDHNHKFLGDYHD